MRAIVQYTRYVPFTFTSQIISSPGELSVMITYRPCTGAMHWILTTSPGALDSLRIPHSCSDIKARSFGRGDPGKDISGVAESATDTWMLSTAMARKIIFL